MSRNRQRTPVAAAIAAATLLVGGAEAMPAATSRTEVVHWSPFDSSSHIKSALVVKRLRAGNCVPGSEAVGDVAYRCGSGHFVIDPCWRDGPNRTEFVVCADDPWATSVVRFRVPRLLLRAGVTFGRAPVVPPWGIELTNGDRCTLLQGAHDALPKREGGLVVDYRCRSGIVLLRDIRRGRIWRIGAARYTAGRYVRLGEVTIRRVYVGALPRAMKRQDELARRAIAPATRAIRRRSSSPTSRTTPYGDQRGTFSALSQG